MGVSHSKVDSLQDMHWKALRRLEQIVGTRRRLSTRARWQPRNPTQATCQQAQTWDITGVGLGVLDSVLSVLGPTFSPDAQTG